MAKNKKNIKVRDLKPKKDAKGGGGFPNPNANPAGGGGGGSTTQPVNPPGQ